MFAPQYYTFSTEEQHMRKRTPTKRNLNNLLSKSITKFPSTKSDDSPTITESPLEAFFCYHLEFDK